MFLEKDYVYVNNFLIFNCFIYILIILDKGQNSNFQ